MSPSRRPPARAVSPMVAVAIVFLAATALLIAHPADASAGRYEVVQCDRSNRAFADAEFERVNGGDYGFLYRCEEDEDGSSLQIRSITGAPHGRFGRISWRAPDETRIMGVELEARLRSDAGQEARLSFLDAAGLESGRIATGDDSATGFASFARQLGDGGRHGFAATLTCVVREGCRSSDQARNWIRSVDLTLEDRTPPEVAVGGSLSSAGWHRGEGTIGAVATDGGSGVRRFDIRVNGTAVPPSQTLQCSLIPGTPKATRLRPCPAAHAVQASADTAAGPYVDGPNTVRVCASDYGSDARPGCTDLEVRVDNAAPELAFEAIDRADPELIRASAVDRHSGLLSGSIAYRPLGGGSWRELPTVLAGGEFRARVDSSAEPRGRYVFRVVASDVAGNSAVTTSRKDGTGMVVDFPLRDETRLEAAIDGEHRAETGYGGRPELRALLRGPRGRGLAREPVEVIERFAEGSSLEPVGRTVETDSNGRLAVRLSRGPSRTVQVRYLGSRRYVEANAAAVRLSVGGSARIEALPRRVTAGRRVAFRGSIGAFGASIPNGKLVELQVRGGGVRRYRTVGRAFRTDPRGGWRMRYRFDRFYERPTRYRFRLKVSRERSFPYETPAMSQARRLTVGPGR